MPIPWVTLLNVPPKYKITKKRPENIKIENSWKNIKKTSNLNESNKAPALSILSRCISLNHQIYVSCQEITKL